MMYDVAWFVACKMRYVWCVVLGVMCDVWYMRVQWVVVCVVLRGMCDVYVVCVEIMWGLCVVPGLFACVAQYMWGVF